MKGQSSKGLKMLTTIHMAMLLGQILAIIIIVFVFAKGYETPQMTDYDSTFQVIAVAIAAAGFFIGTKIFKKRLHEIRESGAAAQEKFNKYKGASILLWAMIEAPALLCIIFFYLTANYAFIALAAVLIFLFFIFGPNRQKLSLFLGLSDYEIDDLK